MGNVASLILYIDDITGPLKIKCNGNCSLEIVIILKLSNVLHICVFGVI